MKKLHLLIVFTFCVSSIFSQVGINTTNPSADLDVNGTMRVRNLSTNSDMDALKILGLDEDGNFVEVEIDENIILEDNKLRVVENRFHSAFSAVITDPKVHNRDLLILPGEPNDDKKIIKIITDGNDVEITGIKAGEDGQMIWLMAFSKKVRLVKLSSYSEPENQFLLSGNITIDRFHMAQLVYDALLEKWLLMEN